MEIPRHWRLKAQRYRMEGSICLICGQPAFPPRLVCPYCAAQPARINADKVLASLARQRTVDVHSLKET